MEDTKRMRVDVIISEYEMLHQLRTNDQRFLQNFLSVLVVLAAGIIAAAGSQWENGTLRTLLLGVALQFVALSGLCVAYVMNYWDNVKCCYIQFVLEPKINKLLTDDSQQTLPPAALESESWVNSKAFIQKNRKARSVMAVCNNLGGALLLMIVVVLGFTGTFWSDEQQVRAPIWATMAALLVTCVLTAVTLAAGLFWSRLLNSVKKTRVAHVGGLSSN